MLAIRLRLTTLRQSLALSLLALSHSLLTRLRVSMHVTASITSVQCAVTRKTRSQSFMMDSGIPCEDDKWSKNNTVFSFPVQSPDKCITRDDLNSYRTAGVLENLR